MASKELIMRVQLDSVAKERLDQICTKRGMTQIALMSRLVNWFSRQDDLIQTIVVGSLSKESLAALTKSFLKKGSLERAAKPGDAPER